MGTALIPDQPNLSTPLIARALHLEALAQALPGVQAGRGRAILISGEAGVGKSRLLREFCLASPPPQPWNRRTSRGVSSPR